MSDTDTDTDQDDSTTTKKVQVEVEINAVQGSPNRFQKLIDAARAIDAWRPFPRLFIGIYIYILYRVIEWYLLLENPSAEQTALISVITGVGAAWFSSYVNSGKRE